MQVAAKQPKVPGPNGVVANMETLGKAAGTYYRSLKENGIPHELALTFVQDWHDNLWSKASEVEPDEPEDEDLEDL